MPIGTAQSILLDTKLYVGVLSADDVSQVVMEIRPKPPTGAVSWWEPARPAAVLYLKPKNPRMTRFAFRSDRMLKLCLDLRGFYLKSGQFLGTRHDFMPKIFLKKLGWAICSVLSYREVFVGVYTART